MISSKVPEEMYNATVFNHVNQFFDVQSIEEPRIRLYSIVLQFELELPQSTERVRKHLVRYLKFFNKSGTIYTDLCTDYRLGARHNPCPRKEAITVTLKNASFEFYKKLMEEIIGVCLT